ncbi:metal ABC transporter permease [Brockia lithotrophica]|uniref:Zinc transport system permease protein n=1 Tax=Brockia lithotrophica TaxID=933949 RepID=A0A660L4S8_9BACL|nr:metal ABC transporter permease [Brockia lithotrophica]RKQ88926.1 zinc transport system permease protein [Brockia lithotrophica]
MREFLEALLTYRFLQNALLGGLLTGFVAPLIGTFVLVRRLPVIADALAHIALPGVATGIILASTYPWFAHIDPVYFGMLFALLAMLFIEKLRGAYRSYSEIAIPIALSTGVGFGVVLLSIVRGLNVDVFDLLFGNILSVTSADLYRMAFASAAILFLVVLFYKELLFLSFDEDTARVSGVPAEFVNFLFAVLLALVIGVALNVVGMLLVSALITLPVATAVRLARSFKETILLSVLFGEWAVLTGTVLSYTYNLATGGTIVLVAALTLLFVLTGEGLGKRLRRRTTGEAPRPLVRSANVPLSRDDEGVASFEASRGLVRLSPLGPSNGEAADGKGG